MSITRLASAVLVLSLLSSLAGADEPPAVRSTDPIVTAALVRGSADSSTFRALIGRLQASDVIVHIERRPADARASGATRFVVATRVVRYLRITLHADAVDGAMVGLLAHELQHAVEVAEATWVRDEAAYGALYQAIGRAGCGPPQWCFDTAAAVRTGKQVYLEVGYGWRSLACLTASQQEQRQGDD